MKESIKFYRWMLENDTQENCEKYINHSDEDMFQVFKEQTNDQ